MSADTYVQVAKFDDGWRWAIGFMSDEHPADEILPPDRFKYGPFETSIEACDHADANCVIIEYGTNVFWKSDCGEYKDNHRDSPGT